MPGQTATCQLGLLPGGENPWEFFTELNFSYHHVFEILILKICFLSILALPSETNRHDKDLLCFLANNCTNCRIATTRSGFSSIPKG